MIYKKFDKEAFYKRLFIFGTDCLNLVKGLPKTRYNQIYGDQLTRSSSSPGANYIEALESFSKKEFLHKLRICRKELRESTHWLNNIKSANDNKIIHTESQKLINEAIELIKILTSSIITLEK